MEAKETRQGGEGRIRKKYGTVDNVAVFICTYMNGR